MDTLIIKKLPEYDGHELVLHLNKPEIGLRGFISIHRLNPCHPALGATRIWKYKSEIEALRDVLRLSRLMSYKSASAGLPYTGAKGVLMANPVALERRKKLFQAYARVVNELEGKFVTGTDVGVNDNDLKIMRQRSRYFIGSGVDSGYFTARGVYIGINIALKRIFGTDDIRKRSFAIQGVGKTGGALLKLLYEKKSDIYISDIDLKKIKFFKSQFPKIKVINPKDIYKQDADVFCPCALSHSLNKKTIPQLCCVAVVGAANNQLETETDGELLRKQKILYAPDVVVNAGGLISVVDQYEHKNRHSSRRILNKIKGIEARLEIIFNKSERESKPTNAVAIEMVKRMIKPSRNFEYIEK